MTPAKELFLNENGQGLVEYSLILGFIALAVVSSLGLIAKPLEEIFLKVTNGLKAE
ncbi:Flp family type IVb pilin [Desulfitibacter alkalitolerans]|uniref:Flp family type IVb pilin n=1 Tax=Desulfitibacter alkalitolerans TaxID=264641 RepID=UPI000A41C049|nr:Flp family type IVb pilin [Desulfitibacter alkalitolerans]